MSRHDSASVDPSAWATLDDNALIRRALSASDPLRGELLEQLYDRHYERVARWCVRFARDEAAALDLTQQAFLRVHERIATFRHECSFTTWLYTIVRSVAVNRARHDQRRPEEALEPAHHAEGLDGVARAERDDLLRRALDRLNEILEPLEARVTLLHLRDGMSLRSITELLQLDNRSGAKAYFVSAKRKLAAHRRAEDSYRS